MNTSLELARMFTGRFGSRLEINVQGLIDLGHEYARRYEDKAIAFDMLKGVVAEALDPYRQPGKVVRVTLIGPGYSKSDTPMVKSQAQDVAMRASCLLPAGFGVACWGMNGHSTAVKAGLHW